MTFTLPLVRCQNVGVECVGSSITVNQCLHFRVGLDSDINRDSAWQVTLCGPGDVLGKARDFRLTVELGRNGNVHPRQFPVMVLGLGGNPTQVREEALDLTLKVREVIVIG